MATTSHLADPYVDTGEQLARFLKSIVQAVERAFEESGLSKTDLDAVMEEWEKQSEARREAMEREHQERVKTMYERFGRF